MQEEVWKDIPSYEGKYQVSNLGRVKSLLSSTEKILKTRKDKSGYLRINLGYKTLRIHQLVAMAFLGHEPCGMKLVVDHIDGDRTNNKMENLQLITQKENLRKKNQVHSRSSTITYDKIRNTWDVVVHYKGKVDYVGSYKTELEAVYYLYQKALNNLK